MASWVRLLDKTIVGLDALRAAGQPVPAWTLGGGTALMIHTRHRLSRDIDVFISDPQHLPVLSPRLAGEAVWTCDAYTEAPNHLRLIYAEGEIDFIVAANISEENPVRMRIEMGVERPDASHLVDIEHPIEIALNKMHYRSGMLKVRERFRYRSRRISLVRPAPKQSPPRRR